MTELNPPQALFIQSGVRRVFQTALAELYSKLLAFVLKRVYNRYRKLNTFARKGLLWNTPETNIAYT